MARILMAWELGGGLGHLGRLLPLAASLRAQGHAVALACQNPGQVSGMSGGSGVEGLALIQAPPIGMPHHIAEPAVYAEILSQFGLDDAPTADRYTQAWLDVYAGFRPDLIVFDFSPGALVAAMAYRAGRVLFGTGFACPPDATPLPSLRPWQDHYPERLRMSEQAVLDSLNLVLRRRGVEPLDYFAALFRRVDLNVLATFEELDHTPGPRAAAYWGSWSLPGGDPVTWSGAGKTRVFAYLQPFPGLPELVGGLRRRNVDTILYAPGIDARLAAACRGEQTRVVDRPVAIEHIAPTADLAITHASHGLAADMLLAGVPLLAVPRYAEQKLLGLRIEAMGAGRLAPLDDTGRTLDILNELLANPSYRAAARGFAQKYSGRDAHASMALLAGQIGRIAAAHQVQF